ncbi:MAG TPA: hypothetical protein VK325_04805 [Pseudoxanthomonas sp.]|nr:hypothetical protein [Pseudoxanthomonas sp.]
MLRLIFSMLFTLGSTTESNAGDLELYVLRNLEDNLKYNMDKRIAFVSLSDNYPLSEDPNSLAIPDPKDLEKEELQYFRLDSEYRKRLLSATGVQETDYVFIYDYSTDALLSFPVEDLNAVAYLNDYRSVDECPCDQHDYMIGLEISKDAVGASKNYYTDVLVHIGEENVFTHGEMKPIVWKIIDQNEFPSARISSETRYLHARATRGDTYLYESNELRYLLQDLTRIGSAPVTDRHLLVIDKKDGGILVDRVFEDGESLSPASLSVEIPKEDEFARPEQWTGKLFRNKPPVLFGLEYASFGCPNIIFLDSEEEDIDINCDNRH